MRNQPDDILDSLPSAGVAAIDELIDRTGKAVTPRIKRGDLVNLNMAQREQAEAWLREAIGLLEQALPEAAGYAARRAVMHRLWSRHPPTRVLPLHPEPWLHLPPGVPDAPPTDPELEAHLKIMDGVYDNLLFRPESELPDGALMTLCWLVRRCPARYCMDIGAPNPPEILARYGERAYPAVMHYLAGSDKDPTLADGLPTHLILVFAKLASTWSAANAECFFRAALEAGWNTAEMYLPGEWGLGLWEGFQDSPYGAPARPVAWDMGSM